jgi:hypothetical protein
MVDETRKLAGIVLDHGIRSIMVIDSRGSDAKHLNMLQNRS